MMGRHGYPNVDGVRTVMTGTERFLAECAAPCRWLITGYGRREVRAVRAAIRRHVASTGHQVFLHQTDIYVYGPEPSTR
jgi:hypothetical protein